MVIFYSAALFNPRSIVGTLYKMWHETNYMLNSQDSDDPSFDTYTPESGEVAVAETERSQFSDKIAVHLCLQS